MEARALEKYFEDFGNRFGNCAKATSYSYTQVLSSGHDHGMTYDRHLRKQGCGRVSFVRYGA